MNYMERLDKLQESFKESKKDDLIKFIKKQISFDITQYIDDEYSTRRYLNIEWKKISRNIQNALKSLSLQPYSTFTLQDNGGLGMAVVFKK